MARRPIRVFKVKAFKTWVFHCSHHVDTCGCCSVQRFAPTWREAFDLADEHRVKEHT